MKYSFSLSYQWLQLSGLVSQAGQNCLRWQVRFYGLLGHFDISRWRLCRGTNGNSPFMTVSNLRILNRAGFKNISHFERDSMNTFSLAARGKLAFLYKSSSHHSSLVLTSIEDIFIWKHSLSHLLVISFFHFKNVVLSQNAFYTGSCHCNIMLSKWHIVPFSCVPSVRRDSLEPILCIFPYSTASNLQT